MSTKKPKLTSKMQRDFGSSLLNIANNLPHLPTRKKHRDPILEELCKMQLRQLGYCKLAETIQVCWQPRLRTTAGRASLKERIIELNPKLVAVSASEVQRTLKHELAHILAQHKSGRTMKDVHGPEWQLACEELGIPGEHKCHTLALMKIQVKRKHKYQCPNCKRVLKRVKPISNPLACLKCAMKYNNGKYSPKFRFKKLKEQQA